MAPKIVSYVHLIKLNSLGDLIYQDIVWLLAHKNNSEICLKLLLPLKSAGLVYLNVQIVQHQLNALDVLMVTTWKETQVLQVIVYKNVHLRTNLEIQIMLAKLAMYPVELALVQIILNAITVQLVIINLQCRSISFVFKNVIQAILELSQVIYANSAMKTARNA